MSEAVVDDHAHAVTVSGWYDGQRDLRATGETPAGAMDGALNGWLAVFRDEDAASPAGEEATTGLPFRAEAADLAALFQSLAGALLDEIDHRRFDVRAIQFDGVLRTDTGLTGWGYALAVEGGQPRPAIEVIAAEAESEMARTTIRASLRRRAETG